MRRRAITGEQKEARRAVILDTAWTLFQQKPYDDITVAEVAETAGLAKGTVYLYFQTKEELFLAIQEQQLAEWFALVSDRLQPLTGSGDVQQVVETMCQSLDERPAMIRLFAILHAVLEQNIRYEAALRFKQSLRDQIATASALLERCLPLRAGEAQRFFMWTYALIIGLQQLANPSPVVRDVLESEPGMDVFSLDFCEECTAAAVHLLSGMMGKG